MPITPKPLTNRKVGKVTKTISTHISDNKRHKIKLSFKNQHHTHSYWLSFLIPKIFDIFIYKYLITWLISLICKADI